MILPKCRYLESCTHLGSGYCDNIFMKKTVFCLRPALVKTLLNVDRCEMKMSVLPTRIIALGLLGGSTGQQYTDIGRDV